MAYFYSERGARCFLILMLLLVGWLFMGIGWAAIKSEGKVPNDLGWVVCSLSLSGQLSAHSDLTPEAMLQACAIRRGD